MRRLADRLGIQAPSLYKHVRDKGELEAALISDTSSRPPSASSAFPDGADLEAAWARGLRAFAT